MKITKLFGRIAFSGLALGILLAVNGHASAAHVQQNSQIRIARVNQPAKSQSQQSVKTSSVKTTRFQLTSKTDHYQAATAVNKNEDNHFHHVSKIAHSKLGDRYVYGATGPHTFDCSGFTRYVYEKGAHKILPRTTEAQRESTQHVARGHERKGDLAFFGHGTASHVGLVLGHDKMIDAQNRGVVVERIHAPWWHLIGYGRP